MVIPQSFFSDLSNSIAEPLKSLEVPQAQIEMVIPQSFFSALSNSIAEPLKSLELPQEQVAIENVVTPLNSISNAVESILSELKNRKPAQISVSPNQNINLAGAYVFDNAMKKALVDDITTRIVDAITQAVSQATNQNFSYGS
jgi:hypothetical protein